MSEFPGGAVLSGIRHSAVVAGRFPRLDGKPADGWRPEFDGGFCGHKPAGCADGGSAVAARDEVLPLAQEYAANLAARCSPASMAAIKGQVRRGFGQTAAEAVGESVRLMADSFRSADFQEAARARRERRRPDFRALPGGPRAEWEAAG